MICIMVLVLVCAIPASKAAMIFDFKHVDLLNETDLLVYKESKNIRAVFFYTRDMPRLRAFFKELERAADFLDVYGVKIGIVDCSEVEMMEKIRDCSTSKAEKFIFIYRDGSELLTLGLDTMFDVNSIMSNMLQLVLLREVPILQSFDSLKNLEDNSKGQQDIIFTLQKAIGTYEHRIFMEVAFAYQDKFKFAVATDAAQTNFFHSASLDAGNALVFVLYCRDANPEDKKCHSLQYKDKMDLVSLARFIKAITLPRMFDLPGDGYDMPFNFKETHIMYMNYNKDSQAEVKEAAEKLLKAFHGLVAIVTVDIEKVDLSDIHGPDMMTAPALGIQLRREADPVFMKMPWQENNIYNFIVQRLHEGLDKENKAPSQEDSIKEDATQEDVDGEEERPVNIEEVETQDDQVAEAVFRLTARRIPMDLELVQALTDRTFPSVISESSLLFILFYLPFCSRSMAFLRAYGDASQQLESKNNQLLARVDCHDWTDVCRENNITAYPTLRIYEAGKVLRDYRGPLDKDVVVHTVKLLQYESPVTLTSVEEVDNFIKGISSSGAEAVSNSSVLGLFDDTDKEEVMIFREVSNMLRDKMLFGVVTGLDSAHIAARYGLKTPLIIVYKRNDPYENQVVYDGAVETTPLTDFLLDARIPVLPQLDALLFPQLYKKGQPFAVLFVDEEPISKNALGVLRQVAMTKTFPEIIFCWMLVKGMNSLGKQILFEYNKAASPPALSFVTLRTCIRHCTSGPQFQCELGPDLVVKSCLWLYLAQRGA
ncbi:hypothetical protein ScPMuIL_014992 [Solemya velum]